MIRQKGHKILVFGAYGLLGGSLSLYLRNNLPESKLYLHGSSSFAEITIEFKHTNLHQIAELVNYIQPTTIINLIAKTDVDACELDPDHAYFLNAQIVQSIATAAQDVDSYFIHISTDQIYSGPGPSVEANVNPINVYSASKLQGESYASIAKSCILRTNFCGKSLNNTRKSFSDWLISNSHTRCTYTLFDDIIFSPLSISALCELILDITLQNNLLGVFNAGSSNGISKADFGSQLVSKMRLDNSLYTITPFSSNNLIANRPFDMTMDSSLLSKMMNWNPPSMNATIESIVKDYC